MRIFLESIAPTACAVHKLQWEVNNMSSFSCNCRCRCPIVAIVAAVVLGVVAAFLQITGAITVTPAFLWTLFGIGVVYLGVLAVATAVARRTNASTCVCPSLDALLAGIVGTILFAVVLLGVGIVATSVVSAILVGILVGSFFLMIAATACLVRYLTGCGCA